MSDFRQRTSEPDFQPVSEPDSVSSPSSAHSEAEDQASEMAWAIGGLVSELPELTAQDLKRLLGHSLTSLTATERREARLGLLMDLVRDSQGQVPGVADYDALRNQRLKQGESWPTHSTLIRAYGGHWLMAVRAAMCLAYKGPASKVSDRERRRTTTTAYSSVEIIQAIAECWLGLGLDLAGSGPSQAEYLEWASLQRAGARLAGKAEPRLPTREVLKRHFSTWEKAIRRVRETISSLEFAPMELSFRSVIR